MSPLEVSADGPGDRPGRPRHRDRYGLPLSTSSSSSAAHYVEGVDRLLSWGLGAEACFEQAVLADDSFALPHAGLALLQRWRGETDAARASAEQARTLAASATRRERLHVQVIADESPRALPGLCEHLAEFPGDALALQVAVRAIAQSGAHDWQQQLFVLLDERAPAYGDDWWFLGVHALAHEELGRFEVARRLAERSLAGNSRNAGAAHPLAHVYFETDDHASGSEFLAGWLAGYARGAPYHCHLSWHLALFELAGGRSDRALEVYERSIRPYVMRGAGLVDAASLLWRLQLRGDGRAVLPLNEVGLVAGRSRPGLALADAHAALTLAATGDEAAIDRLIDGLRSLDTQSHPQAQIVLSLVQGVVAFGRGRFADAVRWLVPIADQVVRIGGSNLQRDVFFETLLVACIRAGRVDQAEHLLRTVLAGRPLAHDVVRLGLPIAMAGVRA